jgi:hypothetical protein
MTSSRLHLCPGNIPPLKLLGLCDFRLETDRCILSIYSITVKVTACLMFPGHDHFLRIRGILNSALNTFWRECDSIGLWKIHAAYELSYTRYEPRNAKHRERLEEDEIAVPLIKGSLEQIKSANQSAQPKT